MPPVPVFLLLIRREFAEVAMGIPVTFRRPLIVMSNFITVPGMVVAVDSVIEPVIVTCASRANYRTRQHASE
jgi:hypothetical protein